MDEKARAKRITEALNARSTDEQSETHQLPWRDGQSPFPVVNIPLNAVVLNASSHRIKANIESDAHANIISADPFSDEAQTRLSEIIRELNTEGSTFEELKNNLSEKGQTDPGVVTRKGLLVNANRRAIALRELGRAVIRVAVLPSDADNNEIELLEMNLQVARDFKANYSFSNNLLFVQDLVQDHNLGADQVSLNLGWAASNDPKELKKGRALVEQHLRMLTYIRYVQKLEGPKGRVKLIDFDDKELSLKELDTKCESAGSPVAKTKIRDLRLATMLLDDKLLGYQPLRLMDEVFVEDYLYDALHDSAGLGDFADYLTTPQAGQVVEEPEGLEEFDDEAEETQSARPLLEAIIEARSEGRVELQAKKGRNPIAFDLPSFREEVAGALRDAVEVAREEKGREEGIETPLKRISEARQKVRTAKRSFNSVSDDPEFKHGKFKYEVEKLGKELEKLSRELNG